MKTKGKNTHALTDKYRDVETGEVRTYSEWRRWGIVHFAGIYPMPDGTVLIRHAETDEVLAELERINK